MKDEIMFSVSREMTDEVIKLLQTEQTKQALALLQQYKLFMLAIEIAETR